MSEPPHYSEQRLHSLCEHGQSLAVTNRGIFDNRHGSGELLLAGQLTNRPIEAWLGIRALRLDYVPESGLQVIAIDALGEEQAELIPADWIHCATDAMELELPSDAFYVWASVGVKTRRLRLQVAPDGGLVMRNLWAEKGMAAVVIPLKISGDSWASFPPDDQRDPVMPPPPVAVAALGECQDLTATYAPDGTGIRLDGSTAPRAVDEQFFRPEIMGPRAATPDGPAPVGLRVAHTAEGDLDLTLLRDDGSTIARRVEATRLRCDQGRWYASGEKDRMPALMLLTGSAGSTWEDLVLWRDGEGALLVRGIYRSRGAIFLIPAGGTSELFMRFERLPDGVGSQPATEPGLPAQGRE